MSIMGGMATPKTFRAGDSVSWSEYLPDYLPADGWSLKIRLLWSSGHADIATTPAGEEYAVSLSSSDTSGWQAGSATLLSWIEKTGHKVTLGSEQVTILPDLSAATSHDGRTRNRKALDDAEAALAAYLASGRLHVAEYDIGDKRMKFRAAEEIERLINRYRLLVARENAAMALLEGGSVPGRVHYRAG